jgi:hypothetical protein
MNLSVVHAVPAPVRHRAVNVADVLERLVRKHPQAAQAQLAERFRDRILADEDLALAAAAYVVRHVLIDRDRRSARKAAEPSPAQRRAKKIQEKAEVRKAVTRVYALCLDMLVPIVNKRLRFCYADELRLAGAGFERVAAALPKGVMAGEHLTDKAAHALLYPRK